MFSILLLTFSSLLFSHTQFRSPSGDPWLLTPGPITTSVAVKKAMLHDYGSRDAKFMRINREVLENLVALVHGEETHVAVPLQGSGTFVVEAMLQTMVGKQDSVLILANGAYGRRMVTICEKAGIRYEVLHFPENEQISVQQVATFLQKHPGLTHVAVVYCETTTGIVNPLEALARVTAQMGKVLLVDAISAVGALPIDCKKTTLGAVALSANKCLQGVPGCAFCVVDRQLLAQAKDNARSLSLDLYEQWEVMEKTGQWRFTPPVQVIVALHTALKELAVEGGVAARCQRYQENLSLLLAGMKRLGFDLYIAEEQQSPVIATFTWPEEKKFAFSLFYQRLKEKGFVIYPGKLTQKESFRIGCIGILTKQEIADALCAIEEVLQEITHKQEERVVL